MKTLSAGRASAAASRGIRRLSTRRGLATTGSALFLILALLALQGCERGADSGATANPVAPGRPGTGNEVVTVAPEPGSITESPQVGGSRRAVPEGVTGTGGTTGYPGRTQDRSYPYMRQQPGVGLDGGLGAAPPAEPAASSGRAPG